MPNLFIVGDQQTAAALATALLPSRHTAADRAAAVATLVAANPTVDLERLRPGTVIVVPATIERLRRGAADDPAGDAADALMAQVRQGMGSLVAAAEQAAEASAGQRAETRKLLDGPEVSRLAGDRLLAGNIKSLQEDMAVSEKAEAEQGDALRAAVDGWQSDLKQLRELL
jgi:hypothetical protein